MKILHQDDRLLVLRCGSYLRGVVLAALVVSFYVWRVMQCVQRDTLDGKRLLALTVLALIGLGVAAMLGGEGRVQFDKGAMTAEVRRRRPFFRTKRLVFPLDAVTARLVVSGRCARYDIVDLDSGRRIPLTLGMEGPYNTTIPPRVRVFLSAVKRSPRQRRTHGHSGTTIIAPTELQAYQQYREVGAKVILLWAYNRGLMVWFLLGCFLGMGVFACMGLPAPFVACLLSMIGVILLIGYSQGSLGESEFRCDNCRQPMEAVDVPVVADRSRNTHGRSAKIIAADGYIYFTDSSTSTGGWSFDIIRELQRWYVCRRCMRRFLGVTRLVRPILQTDDREQFECAKSLLEADPDAVEKIQQDK